MSAQFFYVHLKFTPKSVSLATPIGSPHEIVVEVPRGLMRQPDLVGRDFTEKATALDLARDVALKTASPGSSRRDGIYPESMFPSQPQSDSFLWPEGQVMRPRRLHSVRLTLGICPQTGVCLSVGYGSLALDPEPGEQCAAIGTRSFCTELADKPIPSRRNWIGSAVNI